MEEPPLVQVNYVEQQPQEDSAQVQPLDSVEWSASEFIAHQKTSSWFVSLGVGAAIITLIVFLVSRNISSSAVVLMCFIAVGVFAVRKPATKTYRISADGVYVDQKFFSFDSFKSFSIMQEGAIDCIWLRPLKRLTPTVAMYYPPTDEDRIIMMLENFLPMEDRVHDVVDRISQRFRF
jgi:hypothetical protein